MSRPAQLRWLVVSLGCAAVLIAFFKLVPPIAQDPAYFDFADQRRLLGIANFFNVVSNLPFLLVGGWGIYLAGRASPGIGPLRPALLVFFAGVLLTAIGSAAFHLQPSIATLIWDRLPMTIAFAGLVAIIVGLYLSPGAALPVLLAGLLAGAGSVAYWALTESRGAGDLRPYALVQFLPLLLIPLLLLRRGKNSGMTPYLWWLAAGYVVAKLCEHFDTALFTLTPLSGHSLKHLAAAAGTLAVALALRHGRVNSRLGPG